MSDETKKECNHEWIGDTCCQCGIRWQVYADDAIKERDQLRAQLDAVTKERDAEKARLDWLFAETQIGRTVYTTTPLHKFATDQIICDRIDIDAAIAAEKGTK